MKIYKSFLLAKKEVLHAIKDFRVMIVIILSTVIFYPTLIIGSTYYQEKQNNSIRLEIPKIAVNGINYNKIESLFGPVPFNIVYEKDPKSALFKDKIEGILTISIHEKKISMDYQYKTNYSKSIASVEKIKQWILLIEQQKTYEFLKDLKDVDISTFNSITLNLEDVTPKKQKSSIQSIIPYFILLGIIAGSMGIGIDVTAGEKEKKTFITLLASNQTRSEIALGKIISTSFFGILTSLLTIVGFFIGSFVSTRVFELNSQMYIDFVNFVLLMIILIPIAVLLSTTIVLLGMLSNTVKEANSYIMPLYIIVVVAGFISSMIEQKNIDLDLAFIPIVNSVISFKGVLLDNFSISFLLISIVSNIISTIILIGLSIKIFKKEKYTLG